MAHALVAYGNQEDALADAQRYATEILGFPEGAHPDLMLLSYTSFPVDEARRIESVVAQAPLLHTCSLTIIATERLFHEAQNALLKVFEEPPPHATLILIVPAEGQLLPTLRSRLSPLPRYTNAHAREPHPFITASAEVRGKLIAKLLERSRTGNDEEKQEARIEAIRIVEDLTTHVYAMAESPNRRQLLMELSVFLPILHERSAPLKLIFEHLLLAMPKSGKVL